MIVFGVKYRDAVLSPRLREALFQKICVVVAEYGRSSQVVAVGGVEDHVHVLVTLSSKISIEDLVREIKSRTSRWINKLPEYGMRFEWQRGYGAFSYSQSARESVINYIANQEEHHRRTSFREEMDRLFKLYDIKIDPRDLPETLE
ncbi:MAG: IS200/IS605 family transposase [Muribaculaceae bacterium]|nr:IS200/IS605 family transposase [Muribaculaceae bacterium]